MLHRHGHRPTQPPNLISSRPPTAVHFTKAHYVTDLHQVLKGPYYENSTFLVLLHVHLGIWRVYQPKNAEKKTIGDLCYGSYCSETVRNVMIESANEIPLSWPVTTHWEVPYMALAHPPHS